MKKTNRVTLRFDDAEKAIMIRQSIEAGFIKKRSGDPNLSEFIRHQVFQDGSYLNQKEIDRLYEQMKKLIPIGNLFDNVSYHMNRSAKIMREENIAGYPKFKESDLEEMQAKLKEVSQIQRDISHLFIKLLGDARVF